MSLRDRAGQEVASGLQARAGSDFRFAGQSRKWLPVSRQGQEVQHELALIHRTAPAASTHPSGQGTRLGTLIVDAFRCTENNNAPRCLKKHSVAPHNLWKPGSARQELGLYGSRIVSPRLPEQHFLQSRWLYRCSIFKYFHCTSSHTILQLSFLLLSRWFSNTVSVSYYIWRRQ